MVYYCSYWYRLDDIEIWTGCGNIFGEGGGVCGCGRRSVRACLIRVDTVLWDLDCSRCSLGFCILGWVWMWNACDFYLWILGVIAGSVWYGVVTAVSRGPKITRWIAEARFHEKKENKQFSISLLEIIIISLALLATLNSYSSYLSNWICVCTGLKICFAASSLKIKESDYY